MTMVAMLSALAMPAVDVLLPRRVPTVPVTTSNPPTS
jgi:hypothetical protein